MNLIISEDDFLELERIKHNIDLMSAKIKKQNSKIKDANKRYSLHLQSKPSSFTWQLIKIITFGFIDKKTTHEIKAHNLLASIEQMTMSNDSSIKHFGDATKELELKKCALDIKLKLWKQKPSKFTQDISFGDEFIQKEKAMQLKRLLESLLYINPRAKTDDIDCELSKLLLNDPSTVGFSSELITTSFR